jgi:hypothetical protein
MGRDPINLGQVQGANGTFRATLRFGAPSFSGLEAFSPIRVRTEVSMSIVTTNGNGTRDVVARLRSAQAGPRRRLDLVGHQVVTAWL